MNCEEGKNIYVCRIISSNGANSLYPAAHSLLINIGLLSSLPSSTNMPTYILFILVKTYSNDGDFRYLIYLRLGSILFSFSKRHPPCLQSDSNSRHPARESGSYSVYLGRLRKVLVSAFQLAGHAQLRICMQHSITKTYIYMCAYIGLRIYRTKRNWLFTVKK